MIRIFSRGIARIPHLPALLGEDVTLRRHAGEARAVAGWGLRPSAARAIRHAQRRSLPYLALEDGFLRSVEPGPGSAPMSLVVDDLGIYYDAARPSRLEALVGEPLTPLHHARATALIGTWREARVSKYNHLREHAGALPQPYVLVVDQTFGDASIEHGQADAGCFERMLAAALAEHGDCTALVKSHPDIAAGRKRGYYDAAALARMPRVQVLGDHVHPVRLIEEARAVYCVTSQMGFEGLLWGKPVRTFGMPFYAGWGLTGDDRAAPERRGTASIAQLAHAALIAYPRYVHPETGRRCEVEEIVAHLALQRRMRQRFPPTVYARNISRYKRPWVRAFCQGSTVRFTARRELPADARRLVWGRADPSNGPTVHLEDGFLRSVGLGKDLIRPLSWVMDTRGIYYDATRPSDLEHLLQNGAFDAALLERARTLRERIVTAGLTKYNVGAPAARQPARPRAPVILVPGQVEADASIAWGAPGLRRNVELLRAVRAAHPDAWIIYKRHPDVAAGLAAAGAGEASAAEHCDELMTTGDMAELLEAVDEVHTLTSLTGFEALLRGKRVTCYGQPFYAGWGLTRDLVPPPRRTRRLSIDELIAGALIAYPVYVSRTSGAFTTPERALDELLAWRAAAPSRLPLRRRVLRWVLGRFAA